MEYSPPRLHTGMVVVERAIQILKNLISANLENRIGFTESMNRILRVVRNSIYTTQSEPLKLHFGRKPRTELINKAEDNGSY